MGQRSVKRKCIDCSIDFRNIWSALEGHVPVGTPTQIDRSRPPPTCHRAFHHFARISQGLLASDQSIALSGVRLQSARIGEARPIRELVDAVARPLAMQRAQALRARARPPVAPAAQQVAVSLLTEASVHIKTLLGVLIGAGISRVWSFIPSRHALDVLISCDGPRKRQRKGGAAQHAFCFWFSSTPRRKGKQPVSDWTLGDPRLWFSIPW